MKKVLCLTMLLSAALTVGCPPPRNGNTNNGNGNTNQPIAGNSNAGNKNDAVTDTDPKKRSVQISIYDNDGTPAISVAPPLIRVPRNRKFRYIITNNLEQEITKLEVLFIDPRHPGKTFDPYEGDFVIENLMPGDVSETKLRVVKASARERIKYGYTIKVWVKDLPGGPIELDPQVEIVSAL